MAFWSELLRELSVDNIHFTVSLEDKDVAEICVKDKKIIVEIKHPVMAVRFGLKEFIKRHGEGEIDMSAFENIKDAGYKVILKYGLLEISV